MRSKVRLNVPAKEQAELPGGTKVAPQIRPEPELCLGDCRREGGLERHAAVRRMEARRRRRRRARHVSQVAEAVEGHHEATFFFDSERPALSGKSRVPDCDKHSRFIQKKEREY